MINCTAMRSAVILSAALFLVGVLLLLVAETTGLAIGVTQAALALVLAAAAVLALVVLLALLPGASRRLGGCQH